MRTGRTIVVLMQAEMTGRGTASGKPRAKKQFEAIGKQVGSTFGCTRYVEAAVSLNCSFARIGFGVGAVQGGWDGIVVLQSALPLPLAPQPLSICAHSLTAPEEDWSFVVYPINIQPTPTSCLSLPSLSAYPRAFITRCSTTPVLHCSVSSA